MPKTSESAIISDPTWNDLLEINHSIYAEANDSVYPNIGDFFLKIARYASLTNEKGISKNDRASTIHYSVMTLSWALAFINRVKSFSIPQIVWTHFDRCPYCTGLPCKCEPGKKPKRKTFYVPNPPQTVSAFTKQIAMIYPNNTLERSGSHLAAEGLELQEALYDWQRVQSDLTQFGTARNLLMEEYADTLAHLVAVSHCARFDLGVETIKVFRNGCPGCSNAKCTCGYVNTANSITVKE